ncbi:Lar family restriction alleviation protein [Achromobacter xylosoxidans]
MANELLPCPFCSGPAEIYNPFHMIGKPSQPATYRGGVRCRACGCESKATTPPDGAITTWNRRANAAPQASTVAGEARQLPTINVGGKERPQQWFTAEEVRQLLDAAPQASAAAFAKLQSAYVGACDQIAELLAEKQASTENAPVTGEAFMYGIMGPDGKAHFEEFCVSGNRSELQTEVVDHLNRDNPEDGAYSVVALFRDAAPQASAEYERGHADGWAAGWDQAIKQPQADKDGGQQRAGDELTRLLAENQRLRNGVDQDMAEVDRLQALYDSEWRKCKKLSADASAVRRALIAASNYIDTLGGDSNSYRAALSAPQAEQGERDA